MDDKLFDEVMAVLNELDRVICETADRIDAGLAEEGNIREAA